MSHDNKHNLPPLLSEIEMASDSYSALIIARDWGGRQVYIPSPKKLTKTHDLAKLIGFENALKLAKHFATGENGTRGVSIQIPHGVFNQRVQMHQAIDTMVDKKLSLSDIAQELKINIRTVTRQKRRRKTQMIVKTPFDKFFNEPD